MADEPGIKTCGEDSSSVSGEKSENKMVVKDSVPFDLAFNNGGERKMSIAIEVKQDREYQSF